MINHQELWFFSPKIVINWQKPRVWSAYVNLFHADGDHAGTVESFPWIAFPAGFVHPLGPFFLAPCGDTAQVVLMALGLWRTSRDALSRSLVDVNDTLVPFVHHWIGLRQFKGHVIVKPHTSWSCWLVVWNIVFFPIYWECHHPNDELHHFSEG